METDYLLEWPREIQRMLRALGYDAPVSGCVCERTRRACMFYQRDIKLPDTGRVDDETLTRLVRKYHRIRS